jgi:hypothetical protein
VEPVVSGVARGALRDLPSLGLVWGWIKQADGAGGGFYPSNQPIRFSDGVGGVHRPRGWRCHRMVRLEALAPMSDQAYVDLASIGTTIDAGDAHLAAHHYENAVEAYQTAGMQSQTLRAELPTSTGVDQAAALNASLQALQWHLASQATALQAQNLAKQIQALYVPIVNALPQPPGLVVAPTTNVQPAGINWTNIAVWTIAGLGAATLLYLTLRGPKENPTRVGAGPKRINGKKALIAKGRACRFIMTDGGTVSCPGGMLHDPSGRWWPRHSVLCGPFRRVRSAQDDEYTGAARHYLGDSHRASVSAIDTPPKALSSWRYLGEIEEIRYTRTGKKRPGRYYHEFSKPTALATIIRGKQKVRLYRRGRFCRIELPRNAILDTRGFVAP